MDCKIKKEQVGSKTLYALHIKQMSPLFIVDNILLISSLHLDRLSVIRSTLTITTVV